MTKDEAVFELRYNGVSEEDIDKIIDNCSFNNLSPQYLDSELEKLGYDKFFYLEYEDDFSNSGESSAKQGKKQNLKD